MEQIDMRKAFLALENNEQQAITNYFNLHNAACWIYSNLSKPAQEWVTLSINATVETNQNNEELQKEIEADK